MSSQSPPLVPHSIVATEKIPPKFPTLALDREIRFCQWSIANSYRDRFLSPSAENFSNNLSCRLSKSATDRVFGAGA